MVSTIRHAPVAAAWVAVALASPAHLLAQGTTAPSAPGPQPATAATPLTLDVSRYEVEGNTLLKADELAELLQPYTGRVTLARLRAAATALQDRYREAGYGGVVAFLPEQAPGAGVVRLRVLEGKLVRVEITGERQFDRANVLASLPSLTVGSTPRVRHIDAEIQMANENPAKTLQVLLQPGGEPGQIAAQVTVQEQAVLRVFGRVDDTGGKAIGRSRAALGLQHANLWNADHVLTLEYQTAPEASDAVRVFSSNYRAPLYGPGLAIDAYAVVSSVDGGTVGTAAGDLQFTGKGGIGGLRLNGYLPRHGNTDYRVALGLEAREYRNNCAIVGLPAGACGAAGASVSVQPASFTITAQASGQTRWGFSIGMHGNLAAGGDYGTQADFDAVRPGSRLRYTLGRLSGFVATPLAEWLTLGTRFTGQVADQPLVPGEMFGAGGAQSVRGFEERELSGDSGATLSVELTSANLFADWKPAAGGDLRLLAFADAGYVANSDEAPCLAARTQCRMGSLGLGLRASWPSVQLRLDAARAMATGSLTAKGDTRAHVALNFNL